LKHVTQLLNYVRKKISTELKVACLLHFQRYADTTTRNGGYKPSVHFLICT